MSSETQLTTETRQATSGAETWPKVAIIVLNWNGWRDTIECLESLQRLTYPNYQIIVVDNGSTDDSVEEIKAWARGEIPVESKFFEYDPNAKPVQWVEYNRTAAEAGGKSSEEAKLQALPPNRKLVLIHTGENLGFAGGNNVAIRYALERGFEYIGLLNNDTVVECECLTQLIDTLAKNPRWIAISPKILHYAEPAKIWWAGGRPEPWTGRSYYIGHGQMDDSKWGGIRQIDSFSGCCFVARYSTFERLGLLDEDIYSSEEKSLLMAELPKDRSSPSVSTLIVKSTINGDNRGKGDEISPFTVYHARKDWLICVWENGTFLQKVSIYGFYVLSRVYKFTVSFKWNYSLVTAELKAIVDFCLGRWGSYDR